MIPDDVSSSRFPVGSSARSTFDSLARARAIATRCCWPPESCSTFRFQSSLGILTYSEGSLLYQNDADFPTDFSILLQKAGQSIGIENAAGSSAAGQVTEQGGYIELEGLHRDSYYVIPATVSTQGGDSLSLTLVYPKNSGLELFLGQAPFYLCIWIGSFCIVLFLSRFLLKKAFAPSEEMIKSQKDFVAAASHELKSPLAVIMANTEALQDMQSHNNSDPQSQACLDVIDAECSRMSRLVRDMLTLASSDADKWRIQKSEINVDTLLISLYEAYEPVCISNKIKLDLNLDEETYPILFSDRERLFQILSIFLETRSAILRKTVQYRFRPRQAKGN